MQPTVGDGPGALKRPGPVPHNCAHAMPFTDNGAFSSGRQPSCPRSPGTATCPFPSLCLPFTVAVHPYAELKCGGCPEAAAGGRCLVSLCVCVVPHPPHSGQAVRLKHVCLPLQLRVHMGLSVSKPVLLKELPLYKVCTPLLSCGRCCDHVPAAPLLLLSCGRCCDGEPAVPLLLLALPCALAHIAAGFGWHRPTLSLHWFDVLMHLSEVLMHLSKVLMHCGTWREPCAAPLCRRPAAFVCMSKPGPLAASSAASLSTT